VKIGRADTQSGVALIAEVGINHEGSLERAKEMVERAYESGADAVKLQTFIPEDYAPWGDADRLDLLRRFHLDHQSTSELIDWASGRGVFVFSTPVDLRSADLLVAKCPLVKVSSGDLTFFPLLERVARSDADVILSTGASTIDEVESAVALLRRVRANRWSERELAILHCTSLYPARPETLNLRAIRHLASRFPDAVIGYSDHSLGDEAAVTAVALGARVIEKHFTLDRSLSEFRDHALSMTPVDLARLRSRIDEMEAMLGDGVKVPHADEGPMRVLIRRSIVVSRTIDPGSEVTVGDLKFLRPGSGISPARLQDVVGRVARRPLPPGTVIGWEDVE
jgi:N,N'-diacetyllegionaminate synthase